MADPNIHRLSLGQLFRTATPPPELSPVKVIAVHTTLDPLAEPEQADRWLSPEERHRPDTWRSSARRRHWFAGRIAARIAGEASGWTLSPTAMTVDARPSGSPVLRSWLGELDLSITHSGDWALACTCPPGWWMGLDFEVGADVRVHLSKRVCSAAQRTLHGLDPERGTQERPGTFGAIWTIKEALLKAWRVGLVDPLDAIRVGRLPAELDGPVEVSPSDRSAFASVFF
ncbi:MAG: 4'-phosphopantetheinyl transferase superfamily protein, partial [Myxococcota bacterium]